MHQSGSPRSSELLPGRSRSEFGGHTLSLQSKNQPQRPDHETLIPANEDETPVSYEIVRSPVSCEIAEGAVPCELR